MMKSDAPAKQRRVGTFTLGVTLVVFGAILLISMLLQPLQIKALVLWALRFSPFILICLGVETLLAARGGNRVKYDWLGMLLCFILTGAALCLFAAAWLLLYAQEYGLTHFYW